MLRETISHHIELIYPAADAGKLSDKICAAFGLAPDTRPPRDPSANGPSLPWSQADSFLITYGDTILCDTRRPLQNTLHFLRGHLNGVVNGVHILPFFPFTSDDGFAVSDYETVRPDLGDWDDILRIGENFRLMSDVVINHASADHPWFHQFLDGAAPG